MTGGGTKARAYGMARVLRGRVRCLGVGCGE